MGGKVGENPAALRAAVFSISSKNLRGAFKRPPPAGRGLTKRYFMPVLISDINAYNDGRGSAAPQARNFVFKFFLLVSSHSKFLDEFQLLFTE